MTEKPSDAKEREDKKKRKQRRKHLKSGKSGDFGESLSQCTDVEWNVADPAYGSELINLKKKPNKVTVFTGPGAKTIERTIIKNKPLLEGADERANAIGRLASAVAHLYLTSKNERSVEVDIGVKEMKKSETVNNSSATVELKKSVS